MARVTVEDCILKEPNRFRLVMMAAHRARMISVNSDLTVERDNDKNPVVALREIAEETIELDGLQESMIATLQDYSDPDEPVEEESEFDRAVTPLGTPVLLPEEEDDAMVSFHDDALSDDESDEEEVVDDDEDDEGGLETDLEESWSDPAGGFEDVPEEDLEGEE